jgi:hypothetical protein
MLLYTTCLPRNIDPSIACQPVFYFNSSPPPVPGLRKSSRIQSLEARSDIPSFLSGG